MNTLSNVDTLWDREKSPCTGLTPDALPEVQKPALAKDSQRGASTKNVQTESKSLIIKKKLRNTPHWYALRTTYGREKKAYEYFIEKKIIAFYPTLTTVKLIGGRKKVVESSRFSNIFFAYGTEDKIKSFVYDNVNLPYVRFYYQHSHVGCSIEKKPLIIPDDQIESLKIICAAEAKKSIMLPIRISKFETGQLVRIVDGVFKGVIGRVARYQGQQRVGVVIDKLLTVATAYIPNAFLKKIE